MKSKFSRLFIVLASLAFSKLNSQLSPVFAQGSLTPPGGPAPTMLTLNQIEPRTPIGSLPYTITNPGSYFITGNLTGIPASDGIIIKTNDVTLDLQGFILRGVVGSGNGINVLNPTKNLVIRNGVLEAWGGAGLNAANCVGGNLEDINTFNCSGIGITVGDNWIVRKCLSSGNASQGIYGVNNCTIKDSNAKNNGTGGIVTSGNNCLISGCVSSGSLGSFSLASYSTIQDCTASGSKFGITVFTACNIKNCNTCNNTNDGIYVIGSDCQVVGNISSGNGIYGIEVLGYPDRVDGNVVSDNGSYGIYVDNLNVTNCITRNFSAGPGYGGFPGNNDYAPIQSPTNTVASPWANFQ